MKRGLIVGLVVLLIVHAMPITAFGATNATSLSELSNEILRQEIELERYYLKYGIKGGEEPKYRYLRYFALQNAGTACTLGANLIGVNTNGTNLKTPDEISRRTSRKALCAGMLGILFDGVSSGIELTSNGFIALKHKAHRDDPKTAVENVKARLDQIDTLMSQREQLVSQLTDSRSVALAQAETRVLQNFRDWCAYEFSNIYADIKSYQSSNNIYYAMNIASNGCYLAGFVLDYKLFNHPELGGKAVCNALVADALGVADVPASYVGYNILYKYNRARLAKKLHRKLDDKEKDAKQELDALSRAVASASEETLAANGDIRERLSIYTHWSNRYDKYIKDQTDDLRHQAKVAAQGEISGPAIAATYLASDIMTALSFYSTKKENARAQTSLSLAGSVTSLVGTSSSLALTNLMFLNEYMHRKKLRKKHQLPEQLLDDRFKTLDELERALQCNAPTTFLHEAP